MSWSKLQELGITESSQDGTKLTPKWQKLIWAEMKKGEPIDKKHFNLYDICESTIKQNCQQLDPELEIELSYYVAEIVKYALSLQAKK